MAPMRKEHETIRRLAAEYAKLYRALGDHRPSVGQAVAFRRVIFRLYALLKIHLVEEEIYIRVIDHGVAPEAAEVLAAAMDHPVATHV